MYVPNLTDPEYFALEALSNSKMSELNRQENGRPEVNPENYRIGSIVDAILTAPYLVNWLDYTVAGKQYTEDEFKLSNLMCADFQRSVYAPLLKGITQASFVTEIPIDIGPKIINVTGKCKADVWCKGASAGIDLKTTVATTQEQFVKAVQFLDYDRQSAWYSDVMEVDRFLLLGISKKARKIFPYMIKRDDENYLRGKEKYQYLAGLWQVRFGEINFENL